MSSCNGRYRPPDWQPKAWIVNFELITYVGGSQSAPLKWLSDGDESDYQFHILQAKQVIVETCPGIPSGMPITLVVSLPATRGV
jgi:hypothetical protein